MSVYFRTRSLPDFAIQIPLVGRPNMDLLIVSPPVANIGQATAGISVLTAFLRAQGWDAQQWDLSIDAFHHFHSPEVLRRCSEVVQRDSSCRRLREAAVRVVEEIEGAKAALRCPGIERDACRMRGAFDTINDAGIVMTAASRGSYEHNFRHFGVAEAFRSYADLDKILSDLERNPYLEYFEAHVAPRLLRDRPRAVGVSLSYFSQLIPGFTLVRVIRKHLPGTPIVVGGGYLTAVETELEAIPPAVLPADAIVVHDGEEALAAWLECVLGGTRSVDTVPNCHVRGRSFHRPNPRLRAETDLGRLPVPMWTSAGLHLDRYLVPKYPIPLPLARGCYWGRCAFCNISCQTSATYRTRPVNQAIEDMRHAIAESGSNAFDLPVDSFRPQDLHALSSAILGAALDVEWGAEVLLDPGFRDEVVADLARSGCRNLRFGLESASPDTLVNMNKPCRPAVARRILKSCRRHGIRTAVMTIAGFPTESQAGLNQTFDFLVENRGVIDFLTIHPFTLVSGSPMARDPGRYGLLRRKREGVLLTGAPFANTNPVAMQPEDVPQVVASLKSALSEHYTDLGSFWSMGIGGWMTFPACCGRRARGLESGHTSLA